MRIADWFRDARPNSDDVIDLKVLDRHGNPVTADRLFHSGEHQTYTVRTAEGYTVTGTANHPLLCLVDVGGVPTLLWKLIEEIQPDDQVVLQRTPPAEFGTGGLARDVRGAVWRVPSSARGSYQTTRAGFNNLDRITSPGSSLPTTPLWAVRGMCRSRTIASGIECCTSWISRT